MIKYISFLCIISSIYSCSKSKNNTFTIEEFTNYPNYKCEKPSQNKNHSCSKLFLMTNLEENLFSKIDSVSDIEIPKMNSLINSVGNNIISVSHLFYEAYDNIWYGKFDKDFIEHRENFFGDKRHRLKARVHWHYITDSIILKHITTYDNQNHISIDTTYVLNLKFKKQLK